MSDAGRPGDGGVAGEANRAPFGWRQFVWITAGALAVFAVLRLLPTGTNLSHMDFRVDPRTTGSIEFCDPLNPQFIPVVAVRSPVTMTISTEAPAVAGEEVRAVLTLRTGSGKPVATEDLLVTHTRKLHLLVIDPSLADYQHLHPTPTRRPGEWACSFTPRRGGVYRLFGDFMPVATGRGLYASVDLPVAPGARTGRREEGQGRMETRRATRMERDGYRFELAISPRPARAAQPLDLRFSVVRPDGAAVSLEPVMGAFAHLVAFDEGRNGFAHLHPSERESGQAPDAKAPVLNFKLTIPRPGWYTIWAQVNVRGREEFVPFGLEVVE